MFGAQPLLHIDKNVASVEHIDGDYRILVLIERRNSTTISEEEAELVWTKAAPMLVRQRVRFAG